jgi:hypothetical protein
MECIKFKITGGCGVPLVRITGGYQTHQFRVRIHSPERAIGNTTVYQNQISGWEASVLPE